MCKTTYKKLDNTLDAPNQKICKREQQKIMAVFEYIGPDAAANSDKMCFRWDRIPVSVPEQDKFFELKQLENFCRRIEFILNKNSDAYSLSDYEDWRNATRGKGQLGLDLLLKSNFGFFSKN